MDMTQLCIFLKETNSDEEAIYLANIPICSPTRTFYGFSIGAGFCAFFIFFWGKVSKSFRRAAGYTCGGC